MPRNAPRGLGAFGHWGSCLQAAHAPLLDEATICGRRKLFEQRGIEGTTSFDVGEVIAVSDHGGGNALFDRRINARGGALLDRLTHHVHILDLNGESYRLMRSSAWRRRAAKTADDEAVTFDPKPAKSPLKSRPRAARTAARATR